MTAIWFMVQVLFFALCAGAIISVLIFVPLGIYIIPYALWMGNQHTLGRHLDKKDEKFWKIVKHATILYKSWIRRQKPSF
ncbi:hypothetical protein [Paenibacillus sanguinis]|uniref:hypothetical protein n=1 Tax=Paenibacillus sanguinis TaxID=225906 RepID=UPI000371220D|nr:hypothetical protein [Paenibacillus sanguinis]